MVRAGKHSMDAAVGKMVKKMREDKTVDLSNGENIETNKSLRGNLAIKHIHVFTHTYLNSYSTGASFGKAKVLAAALQPLASALEAHSVSRI